jgi:hypothetical protein
MAEPINIDGVLYEELGNGQMRVVGYAEAPTAPQGRVFTLPSTAKDVREEARDTRQESRQDAQDRRAQRDQERQEENDRIARDKADRDQREWDATHFPDGTPRPKEGADTTGTTAKIRADAIAAYQAGEAIKQRVAEMRRLHEAGPGSTSGLGAVQDFFPTEANKAFDQAGNAVRGHVGTALGFTGGQLNSIAEAQMAVGPYLPQSSDYDENAVRKMDRLLEVAGESQKRAIAVLGGVPDAAGRISPVAEQRADNEVPQANGAGTKPDFYRYSSDDPNSGVSSSAASGKSRTVLDTRLNSQIDSLVAAGAYTTANDILRKNGFAPIAPAEKVAIEKWKRQNPGKKYFGANISRNEDLTMLQKAAGSDTGAFLAHMGNMGSAGLAGALAGPEGQGALDAMAANSPNASFAGSLVGGTTGAFGLEAIAAARAPAAVARFAPRFADAAYGGALGFNQAQEGEGLSGALWGAGTSALGGAIGQRVVSGAGSAIGGVRNEAVQVLRDRGIPLTVGQTVGNSGRVGAGIKKIEDALTSIPFVGGMVDARRREGIEAFNRTAFQDAAAPGVNITATGSEGMGQLRQGVQDAYGRALDPVRIDANDPAFIADIAAVNAAAQRIPPVNGAQDAATASLQHRIDGAIDPMTDEMSGRGFQEAYRGLGRTGRERANGDYGHEVGQVMRQGQDALGGALERQNPGAFGDFIEANAANRRGNVIAAALRSAGNQADELITPAQLNRADITSTSRLEGQINSAAGNRPFYELAGAGQRVLPSNLADSGTATRAMIAGLTTGAAGTLGGGYAMGGTEGAASAGLGTTLLLAAGGSRPAQRALSSIMADRPEYARILGQIVQDNARLGGSVGAGAGVALTNGY